MVKGTHGREITSNMDHIIDVSHSDEYHMIEKIICLGFTW